MRTAQDETMYDEDGKQYVSIKYAARKRQVNRRAIDYLIKTGQMPVRMLGGRKCVALEDLERYQPDRALQERIIRARRPGKKKVGG